MRVTFAESAIPHPLLRLTHGVPEVVHVTLFGMCPGERARILDTIEGWIDLDVCLSGRRQRPLSTFELGARATNCLLIPGDVLAVGPEGSVPLDYNGSLIVADATVVVADLFAT